MTEANGRSERKNMAEKHKWMSEKIKSDLNILVAKDNEMWKK